MAPKDIKTGDLVVTDFLASLVATEEIDAHTVVAIKQLYEEDKLTTTKLEQALTQLRESEERNQENNQGGDLP